MLSGGSGDGRRSSLGHNWNGHFHAKIIAFVSVAVAIDSKIYLLKIIGVTVISRLFSLLFFSCSIRRFQSTGTLTVEEVYKDRDQFAALVREVAAPDVGRMGIEILSFTIKDVYDDVQYLASLGKSQTASVKRDADTGVAEANRDAGIREAECEKSAMDVKYATDTKIEDNARMFKLQKANFDQEINTAVRNNNNNNNNI